MNNINQLYNNIAGGSYEWATTLSVKVSHQVAIEEKGPAANILQDIGQYFDVISYSVGKHGGYVQKFDGEQMVALFLDEVPEQAHADRSVLAAINLMKELNDLNYQRQKSGLSPFRLGIGVNTGHVILGSIPAGQAPLNIALGEGVEAAAYLGSLNTQTPFHNVFISESTFSSLHNRNGYFVEDLGEVYLANTAKPLQVYALTHSP